MRGFMGRSVVVLLAVLVIPGMLSAEMVTKQIQRAFSSELKEPFAVENLVGDMKVLQGQGPAVTVTGTVHAESNELAGLLRLDVVTNDKGRPCIRVRYPLDRYKTYRYSASGSSNMDYDGYHNVSVSRHSGVLLYADLEVRVPARWMDGNFVNHVGRLEAEGIEGKYLFDTGTGEIAINKIKGDVVADTGSGDISATDVNGMLRCDTGSGDCKVYAFNGEKLVCDTGSGRVEVRTAAAKRIEADTGSGDIILLSADAEEFSADTGSGDVEVDTRGDRLRSIKADTGSGDVTIRLAANVGFEAIADQGSGDIENGFSDAQPIVEGREVIGYRRGDGRVRIEVDTGSGDMVLEPVP
ncbi:MAG: DUF4097 family beta strand repeat-containing protein [Acidobacteriota bacterium]